MAEDSSTLPYRTTGEEIERFASARARGRGMDQIRSIFSSTSIFQGTVSTATELGLFNAEVVELTERGKRFAMGDEDIRQRSLLEAILNYEPYELLLEAAFGDGVLEEEGKRYTTMEWIEMWWSTNGYGSSQTNRSEGSSAFGNLLDYAGVGTYKQGRRGHPSRIEWLNDSADRIDEVRQELISGPKEEVGKSETGNEDLENEPIANKKGRTELTVRPENNVLTMNLGNDRVAELSLPPKLSSQEKERLLSLMGLMITTDDDDKVQMELNF